MRKVLFIDRDGTILKEPKDKQIDSLEKLEFIPSVINALNKICSNLDYELVMVTNQDGLGTSSFPEESFYPAHEKMLKILKGEGIRFREILIDKTFEHENSITRKPGTGLLTNYKHGEYDLYNSFVIGDRATDIELAMNLGSHAIYINSSTDGLTEDHICSCRLITQDWNEIYSYLMKLNRYRWQYSKTSETEIFIGLDLDGTGLSKINTGLSFFNHMLEQIPKHSGIDLTINTEGDLQVDEHHTIEDTALQLGEVLFEALGSKLGLNRYGFYVPMDECLAFVAIDLCGRSHLEWDAVFTRERIGDFPTEMAYHFFKSFCERCRCCMHVKATGTNEHHKIESIFKAFGRALGTAIKRDTNSESIPSTKGTL